MNSPMYERSRSLTGIPPTESFLEESGDISVVVSAVGEITTPIRKQINFSNGSGYAGTFPTSEKITDWPGPRGGTFIWSDSENSQGPEHQNRQDNNSRIFLHRLEIKIHPVDTGNNPNNNEAYYSCREIQIQKINNPAIGFLKRLFLSPKKTLVHPIQSRGAAHDNRYCILPDYPFGLMGGRDPRPVIWNGKTGQDLEFDPNSLKCRESHKIVMPESVGGLSDVPVYDPSTGKHVVLVRVSDQVKFSKYQIVALHPGMPSIATFMGPKPMSLNLLAIEKRWIVCSPVQPDRRLFYLLDRQKGRLMAVYQSSHCHVKNFINLTSNGNGSGIGSEGKISLVALMLDGSIRRYSFENVRTEVAKFDGAAGLLGAFPVAEFETISNDGPFEQVEPLLLDGTTVGFVARQESSILKMNTKWDIVGVQKVEPAILSDFSIFPMWNKGAGKDGEMDWMLVVLCTDPYRGKSAMLMYDVGDMVQVSRIAIDHEMSGSGHFTPPIYIPTRGASDTY